MKRVAQLAVVLTASALGCVSGPLEQKQETSEEESASVKQAIGSDCDSSAGWCSDTDNGGAGGVWDPGNWGDGGDAWPNSGDAWGDGTSWFNGHSSWSNGYYNEWTSGWAIAFHSAYGSSSSANWNFDTYGDTFGWAEPQSCAHPLTQVGDALDSSCNPMAAIVCQNDSHCCNDSWDEPCVAEAKRWSAPTDNQFQSVGCYTDESSARALPTYLGSGMTIAQCEFAAAGAGYNFAGLSSGGECRAGNALDNNASQVSGSECSTDCVADPWETCGGQERASVFYTVGSNYHPVTVVGFRLPPGHSACAAAVIAENASCSTVSWSNDCVNLASELCVARYVTRGRYDASEDRVLVDACIETKIQGYPPCSIAATAEGECCRRALVLQGIYKNAPETPGYGRQVQWQGSDIMILDEEEVPIQDTLVPDPCVVNFKGQTTCGRPNHLWQAAGPGGTIYPDCSLSGNVRPCNAMPYDATTMRGILIAVQSALTTTSSSNLVDLRFGSDNAVLPWHSDFNNVQPEARWGWDSAYNVLTGKPRCVFWSTNNDGPRDPALVSALPDCANTSAQTLDFTSSYTPNP